MSRRAARSSRRAPFCFVLFCLGLLVFLPLGTVAARAEDTTVTVQEEKQGDTVYLVATMKTNQCLEATVTVSATLLNMTASVPLPLTREITEKRTVLVAFTPVLASEARAYPWRYHWKYGRRLTRTIQSYLYALPYQDGPHPILQSPHGSFSHGVGSQDEDAIDWGMPVGTPICAARAGIVVAVRADCAKGGRDLQIKPDFNYVIVRHDDGTCAEYIHLQQDGVLVHVGEKVQIGQVIARSGDTGYLTEPRLHFAVFYTVDGYTRRTLPAAFQKTGGKE